MPTQIAQPSPKRKRDHPAPLPLLTTALALRPARTPPPQNKTVPPLDGESPRTAMADQLRDMNIAWAPPPPSMPPLTPTGYGLHKKAKLDAARVDSGTLLSTTAEKAHRGALDTITVPRSPTFAASREIPETPWASQPRLLPDIDSFAKPTSFISAPTSINSHQHVSPSHKTPVRVSSAARSRPRNQSLSPSPSALTWKDDEITGHVADPTTDPDDDGTGLNGIGFKPTPAIAYARSQKRRQQLSEWKLRETREARAKRSERRRRGIGGMPSRETTVEREMPIQHMSSGSPKRSVKFAV